jgi:diacylglycerol kinase (ATP)
MSASPLSGIRRIIRATAFSASGLRTAWVNEAAFRQECVLVAVLIPIAFWIGSSAVERALLIGSCLLVLVVELINSAIESTIDRISTDHHPLSGRAKDLGSAAVLMSLALTVTVWLLIGLERFR